jgi:hypothetical protein
VSRVNITWVQILIYEWVNSATSGSRVRTFICQTVVGPLRMRTVNMDIPAITHVRQHLSSVSCLMSVGAIGVGLVES